MTGYEDWVSDPSFLVVISGPSGAGKSCFCRAIVSSDPKVHYSISATTRPRRSNEEHGREYFFVTRDEFARMRDSGELAEWAEVHGAQYGSPRRYLDAQLDQGFIVILDIDVQGGLSIKGHYPDAVLIFILPPSPAVLESRLRGRGTDADAIVARRMAAAPEEIAFASRYDYVVVNGDFETALARVRDIVGAERSRRERCYRPEGRALPEERRSNP